MLLKGPRHGCSGFGGERGKEVAHLQPAVPFKLDTDLFLVNLSTSRRGAAQGPSGMHLEHLFPLLERPLGTVGTSGKCHGSG